MRKVFDPKEPVIRWTFRRKLSIIKAMNEGKMTIADVVNTHGLSLEEINGWVASLIDDPTGRGQTIVQVQPPSTEDPGTWGRRVAESLDLHRLAATAGGI